MSQVSSEKNSAHHLAAAGAAADTIQLHDYQPKFGASHTIPPTHPISLTYKKQPIEVHSEATTLHAGVDNHRN